MAKKKQTAKRSWKCKVCKTNMGSAHGAAQHYLEEPSHRPGWAGSVDVAIPVTKRPPAPKQPKLHYCPYCGTDIKKFVK